MYGLAAIGTIVASIVILVGFYKVGEFILKPYLNPDPDPDKGNQSEKESGE